MEISNLMKEKIIEYLNTGKRFDGRKFDEYRNIEIETNVSKNAEGSSRVKLGNTEVIVGVKIDVSEPYTDNEDEGTLITSAELIPLASDRFELGPPRIEAVELARIIDRGIRESKFIDFKKLCIKKGEKVYCVFLDIYPINYDGNLIDASFIASVCALLTAKMPKYDEEKEKIKYGELTNKNVPLSDKIPVMITSWKIENNIIIDPTLEEEDASNLRLSIAVTKEKKEFKINAIQKGGEGTLTEKDLDNIFNLVKEKAEEILKKIEKAIK
ncbi:MAG: exosome complex protein Rrp42 [Candidatus Pacearchaeota archaeon]